MGAIALRGNEENYPGVAGLSRQEQLILSLAGQGLADKEIAKKIGISMGTVRTYWQRMRDKTNARSRSEILSLCLQNTHSQAVSELQRLKDRFSALVEASGVGLALLGSDQEIVEVNSAFAAILGMHPAELVGLQLSQVPELKAQGLSGGGSPIVSYNAGGSMLQLVRQPVDLEGERYEVVTLISITRVPDLSGSMLLL